MKISFESKGDFGNLSSWLNGVSKHSPSASLNRIASEGVRNLSLNTPKDTGETAAGWESRIVTNGDTAEISWINTAHPESEVNVAKLIDIGYGTRTGGFVPPRHYIRKSMRPAWKEANNLVKELIE